MLPSVGTRHHQMHPRDLPPRLPCRRSERPACGHVLTRTSGRTVWEQKGLDLPQLRNAGAGEQVAMVIAMVTVSHIYRCPLSSRRLLSLPLWARTIPSHCTPHARVWG